MAMITTRDSRVAEIMALRQRQQADHAAGHRTYRTVVPIPVSAPVHYAGALSADSRITCITLTGDRPLAFALCQRWMANQNRRPGQWIVIDDGKTPLTPTPTMQYVRREPRTDDPRHTLIQNMKVGLPLVKGEKVIIFEDDEYYAPEYIEEMSRRLDEHEVVGIMKAKYYHLPTGGYRNIQNTGHASLAETAFRASIIPELSGLWDGDPSLDLRLWGKIGLSRGFLFVDTDKPLYLGIKGLPGRMGMAGYNPAIYPNKDSTDRAILKKWVPKDYQVYLDILNGKLTSENYRSYFPADLPITGITVCWNTKDLINRAYESIRKFHPDMPIIIIDGSDPGNPCAAYTRGLVSAFTTVVSLGYNIGHGRGLCMGIDKAKTPYALVFDSDIEMLKSPVTAMLTMMESDTFGVGYIEKAGHDGFVYGVHPHVEGPMPYLHPFFQLIDIRNYRKFHPYVHHGAPCYLTILDIHKRGLSGKIIKQFPGLSHTDGRGCNAAGVPAEHIRHDTQGTRGTRMAKGLPDIERGWVMNRGLV
jgi:glycosyltransferase involved in cell wall biosynthesis